jgi:hypothetical protein
MYPQPNREAVKVPLLISALETSLRDKDLSLRVRSLLARKFILSASLRLALQSRLLLAAALARKFIISASLRLALQSKLISASLRVAAP